MTAETLPPSAEPDRRDEELLASIRLDQSYSAPAAVAVTKPLLTVPVRKPGKTEFFRVHPKYWLDCLLLEQRDEGEVYFVTPALADLLSGFVVPVRLRLCVTRQGTVLIWPVKLPRDDARGDSWRRSAAEAAAMAEGKWIRIVADRSIGAYQPFVAQGELGDPRWPAEEWSRIMAIAMRDRLIDSDDHPVVLSLFGQP